MPAPLRRILSLAAGLAPVVFIYATNAHNRVLSYHGLCHGSLVYQLAGGSLPPTNPYLAETPLRYYWGYHALAAGLVKLFPITPFHAFALINMLSLGIALIFIFRTSQRLLSSERAGLIATFVALYAASGPNPRMMRELIVPHAKLFAFLDWRGGPRAGEVHERKRRTAGGRALLHASLHTRSRG